jgi:integrase
MGRHTDERDRVLGPTLIPSKAGRKRWRVVVISPKETRPGRRRVTKWYATDDEAQEVCDQVKRGFKHRNASTIESAISGFVEHLREKGTGSISYKETERRLRLFFPALDMLVTRVSPEHGEAYYAAFRKRKKADGSPISVDYHRSALINARSLFKWCVKHELVPLNPFTMVEGIGRRRHGKPQHTGDEAARFFAYCLPLAKAGDKNALACLMALLMALRSADLCRRLVRDVDMGGTVLRVSAGKTDRSNRARIIPAVLRPMLVKLIRRRKATEPLFVTPYTNDGHHTRRWLEQAMVKLCKGAKVPYACPHALKGTAGTVLAETGALAEQIADHLSHEKVSTTRRHYVAAGALEQAKATRGAEAISGTNLGTRYRKRSRK